VRFFCALVFVFIGSVLVVAAPSGESTPAAGSITPKFAQTAADMIDYFPVKLTIDHSELFDVDYYANYKIVTIAKPWPGSESHLTYVLVQRGTEHPSVPGADLMVEIPIRTVVTMSTSYLPHVEMLDVLEALVGTDAFAWVTSEAVRERIDSGAMQEFGSGPTVNIELLLDLDPDLVMTYGQGTEWDTHPKLREAGIPFALNAEWNESEPLARAEWMKFMALFFNRGEEANELFGAIVARYGALKDLAAGVGTRPSIFMGSPYQGTWWVSGGDSYAARFFADAGGDYIWSDDDSTGSLMLDVESVFDKAGDAEFWLNTGTWTRVGDAISADARFATFHAFETKRIYNNNLRMGPGGGNDYFESGPSNPDVILADIISIIHPELLPDHERYYYHRLD